MLDLSTKYNKTIQEEAKVDDDDQKAIMNVGKIDAKKRLEVDVELLMTANIVQSLGAMLDVVVF